ncbi:MAG: c-type cytochrome [Hellea sp.]|nr:c-type cytochrome [Hellea sp.]
MSGDLTFNKYAAAILATALGFMLIKEVSHSAMHIEIPEVLSYGEDFKGPQEAPVKVEPLPFPQADWVAAMEMTAGEKAFKACIACHKIVPGETSNQGPNLYNIVGRQAASTDFAYSDAMKSSGITWTYEELDNFLSSPKTYIAGTKMGYAGIKKMEKRAAVIEYLRMNSDAPMAPPEPVIMDVAPAGDLVEDMSVPNGESIEQAVEVIVETPQEIIEAVEDMSVPDGETIEQDVEALVETPEEIIQSVSEGAETTAEDVIDTIENTADDLVEEVSEGAEDLIDKVEEVVTEDE